jgi:hypothetical protein
MPPSLTSPQEVMRMVPRPQAAPFRRRFVPFALVLAAFAAAGCSSARPELPRSPQARHTMREQGAALIDSLVAAHGGMAAWGAVREMTFRGTDEWTGPTAKILNPWPVERAAGENRFRVHEGLGRAAIVTDEGTLTYGTGRAGSWALLRGAPSPRPEDERSASYIIGWHNFMAGLPFRFKESGAVAHALGRAHRKYLNSSQEFEEVLVTFPPEGDVWPDDWFVVRMDPNTHEMRTVTYVTSARSQRLFETTCEFSDYVVIEGLKIATKRTCAVTSPVEAPLHTWTMADLRFNQVSPDDTFERRTAAAAPAAGTAIDSLGAAASGAAQAVGQAAESLVAKSSDKVGEAVDTLRAKVGASPR